MSTAFRPPVSTAPPNIELRLLGGASLLSADGESLGGRAAHRHRLALLARLAMAAPAGVTRDKLVGLLWPERDETSARQLLRGALHDLRGALGADVLTTSGNDVRLDPRLLPVDVRGFEARLAQGDPEGALSLYRGPFLDGFHLDDAEAFDEWMTAERARLAAVYELTLERLATASTERGDGAAAVRWWRTLAAARPADGRVVLRLMEALVSEGDPAGALTHAAAHTEWLRTELGVGPDPSLARRVSSLRRGMPAGTTPVQTSDASTALVPGEEPPHVGDDGSGPSARVECMPGIELRLLGGARLLAANGEPLTGRAAQRHRLALLARLAIAAPASVPRDDIVALLWPDRDPAAAKHLLRAALHDLRQELGADLLPIGGSDLRLDPRRMLVDVHAFTTRVAAGDPIGAVEFYRGPFLDGFFLDGAPAFAAWVTAERARLAALYEQVRAESGGARTQPRAHHRDAGGLRRRWLTGLVALVAVVVVGMGVRVAVRASAKPAISAGAGTASIVAVAPFELVGAVAPDLRDGLATLLTANLDQVEELRLVPAAQVAGNVAGGEASGLSLLRAVRAEFLVSGIVVPAPEGISVTAHIMDRDGAVRGSIETRGSPSDLASLVDRISLSLLRELWGRRWGVPEPRLAAVATESPPALRAYLRGEMFLRAALWDSAASALAEAIDDDSTFALAHMRLAEPYGWRYGMSSAPAQASLAAAARYAERLPPRERMLLVVRRLHEAGSLAALDSSAALAERYPDDAEAQYVRADVRFHAMEALGHDMLLRAAAAFDTAMTLDSVSARVFAHPLSLSLVLGDSLRFDHSAARLDALGGGSHMNVAQHWDYRLLRRARFAPPAAAVRVLTDQLRREPPPFWQITDLLPAVERAVYGAQRPQPESLLGVHDALRSAYRADPQRVAEIDGIRATVLMGLGRMNAARTWLGRAWDVYPNAAPGGALTPVAFGYAPPGWLDGISKRLADDPYWQSTPVMQRKASYWQGMIALASDDLPGARAGFARAGAPARTGVAGDTVGRPLAAALRAASGWSRFATGDTIGGLREVEAGLRDGGYDGDALMLNRPIRIWFTRTLAAIPSRRSEAIDRIRGELLRAEGYRLAWWRLELSRALAADGDSTGAAEERRRFDALWAGADASARSAAWVERVGTDGAPPAGGVR